MKQKAQVAGGVLCAVLVLFTIFGYLDSLLRQGAGEYSILDIQTDRGSDHLLIRLALRPAPYILNQGKDALHIPFTGLADWQNWKNPNTVDMADALWVSGDMNAVDRSVAGHTDTRWDSCAVLTPVDSTIANWHLIYSWDGSDGIRSAIVTPDTVKASIGRGGGYFLAEKDGQLYPLKLVRRVGATEARYNRYQFL